MACSATNLSALPGPCPGGTATAFVLAAAAALGLSWGVAAIPAHLEDAMSLPSGTYPLADLLTLRGAVVAEDLDVMAAVARTDRDFDALVASATADGHGSLQQASLGD